MADAAVVFIPIGIILILIALIFAWIAVRNLRQASSSKSWPTALAQVTSAVLGHTTDSDDNDIWDAQIAYEYVVGGQTFTGKRIAFGSTASGSQKEVQKYLDKYAVGSQVDAFYDPTKPDIAVLEPRASGKNYVYFAVAAVFIAIGAWMLTLSVA